MEARGDRFDLFTFFPSLFAYAGTRPVGCVVYNDSKVDIPPGAADAKFIDAFEYFLGVIAGLELRDIARTECPERIEDQGVRREASLNAPDESEHAKRARGASALFALFIGTVLQLVPGLFALAIEGFQAAATLTSGLFGPIVGSRKAAGRIATLSSIMPSVG